MAALQPAVDRIAGLLGTGEYRATPATITAPGAKREPLAEVYSYRMRIGREVSLGEFRTGWLIVSDRCSTPTTNRHIRALESYVLATGAEYVGVVPVGYSGGGHRLYAHPFDSDRAIEKQDDSGQLWFNGLCLGTSLYDSIRGPYGSELEALANRESDLEDYGNPAYSVETFPQFIESVADLESYLTSY